MGVRRDRSQFLTPGVVVQIIRRKGCCTASDPCKLYSLLVDGHSLSLFGLPLPHSTTPPSATAGYPATAVVFSERCKACVRRSWCGNGMKKGHARFVFPNLAAGFGQLSLHQQLVCLGLE